MSNDAVATTPPVPVAQLPAPVNLQAPTSLITTTSITLVWNGVPCATQYRVERSTDGGQTWTLVGISQTPLHRTGGLTTHTSYQFRVTAANENPANDSPVSAVLTATTK